VVLISFGGNFYTTTQMATIGFTGMKMMIYRHSAKIAFVRCKHKREAEDKP
jgi:hypothetical protein